jgi:two-component system, response regulator PdtaR
MHAYIIEDDYLISRSIQDMLGDIGFTRFSFARSEDVAVLGAGEQKFDLITADARLLPGDGVSAVQTICARRDIPVVFVTGYTSDINERVPDAVIVEKPIKVEELRAAVRAVLDRRTGVGTSAPQGSGAEPDGSPQ